MRLPLAVSLVLTVVACPAGGAPPVPGVSANVEIVSYLPDVQTMGGRFVGRYLYTTGTAGLRVYDTADPAAPVLVSALPIPVFSNEDVTVSAKRKLVLLSSDLGGLPGLRGTLVVVDVSDPATPRPVGSLAYQNVPNPPGTSPSGRGVGHIANCIDDCARYAWITGAQDGWVLVVDLADPANPKAAGWVHPQQNKPNPTVGTAIVHDVHTDSRGEVWVSGSQGISRVDARKPLKPVEQVALSQADANRLDQMVFHNVERLDARTLLATEEDWETVNCDPSHGGAPRKEGSFQTFAVPQGKTGTLRPLDEWTTELGTYVDGGAATAVACSSHWFDVNNRKVVADAWYQQGIRFLDVSNPRDIRQVGYYIPPWESGGLGFSQALWVPGHPDYVYGMSLTSGLTVLRFTGTTTTPAVRAPILPEWLSASRPIRFAPHPTFGWACPVIRAGLPG